MELSKEPISVRTHRIAQQIDGKCSFHGDGAAFLTKDGLLDALQVLYDECSADCLKNSDEKIAGFVKRYCKVLREIKQLRANITDFEVKSVIGRGHFGDVHVVQERQTCDFYALKTVKKSKNTAFEEERDIMATTQSPWHTNLQYAFQDSVNLYFVMEYHPGGDLLGLLYRQGGTLPESAACFYIAELVLALNDLHAMGYVHRDVKPDNILLDRCGHLKLADFGSAAKLGSDGTLSDNSLPVGTPEYIAPEVLQILEGKPSNKSRYGVACDYWSVGVVAYEMTVGNTPFTEKTTTEIYANIMNNFNDVKFPDDIVLSQAYVSLVKGLLKDQKTRLGFKTLVCHDLFKNTDFSGIRDQVPPFVPNITSVDDVSNFSDIQPKNEEINIENYKLKTKFSGKNLPYIGFTYTQLIGKQESILSDLTAKDSVVQSLKSEIEMLQKRLLKTQDPSKMSEELEMLLEEKNRKLQVVEAIRTKLEQELVSTISELSAHKRTLEFEKHERAKLETKALEMIKSAKEKWEVTEKMRAVSHEEETKQHKEKIAKLAEEKQQLEAKLEKLTVQLTRKDSIENIAKLSRRSVIGLENRLQKLSDDSQIEQDSLKKLLKQERQEKLILEKKYEAADKQCAELSKKFDSLTKKYEDLSKNFEEVTAEKLCLARRFEEAIVLNERQSLELKEMKNKLNVAKEKLDVCEDKLDSKEKQILTLERHMKDLQKESDQLKDAQKLTLKEQKDSFERKLQDLKKTSSFSKKEKDELELKLKEAELRDHDNRVKVKTLEELLARLENGVTKLEHSSEREVVLQEQIDRLELQIAKIHESSALEHQELSELKSKSWRLEKEHSNAILDRKIVERDLKDAKIEHKKLQTQIEEQQGKMKEARKAHEAAVMELEKLNENLATEILRLKENVRHLEDKVSFESEKRDGEKKRISELQNAVVSKDGKIKALESTIQRLEMEKFNLNGKVIEHKDENSKTAKEIENLKHEVAEWNRKVKNAEKQMENTQLNLTALREACSLQENQLVEYEKIHDTLKIQLYDNEKKVEAMLNELTRSKFEHIQSKKEVNEEKSLKLKAETQRKKLEEETEGLRKELKKIELRYYELENYSTSLSDQLQLIEEKSGNLEVNLKSTNRKIDSYISENNILKEKNSTQITHINNLKESNYKLNQALLDVKSNNVALLDRVTRLESALDEKINYHKQREIKTSATILQQTKLIDYLQCKLEENNKKKRTLSDKLFGSSKKNNPAPISMMLNYRDLESELAREKEEKNELKAEITKLKTESVKMQTSRDVGKILAVSDVLAAATNDVSIESTEVSDMPLVETSLTTKPGEVVANFSEDIPIMINAVVDLTATTQIVATNKGLFSVNSNDKKLLIHGLESVHEISILPNLQTVLMIANGDKSLILCDLQHVINLTQCAEVTKPTLKHRLAYLDGKSGFHLLKTSSDNNMVCLATTKQLVIAKIDEESRDVKVIRFIDTLQPITCILFTTHSLIIGADKFFEIDSATLQGEEFLDPSDKKLSHAIKCYKIGSRPLAVFQIRKDPVEILVCFKEFATFVDEYGRSSRNCDVKWLQVPFSFEFVAPYLYIAHTDRVSVYRIDNEAFASEEEPCITFSVDLPASHIIGSNKKGVYVKENACVRFISSQSVDLEAPSFTSDAESSRNGDSSTDRFSFTSSIVQSLDGNLSDDEGSTQKKRVKFHES